MNLKNNTNKLVLEVTYDELKTLTNNHNKDIKDTIKSIKANAILTIEHNGQIELITLYDTICIDTKEGKVTIIFNDKIKKIIGKDNISITTLLNRSCKGIKIK